MMRKGRMLLTDDRCQVKFVYGKGEPSSTYFVGIAGTWVVAVEGLAVAADVTIFVTAKTFRCILGPEVGRANAKVFALLGQYWCMGHTHVKISQWLAPKFFIKAQLHTLPNFIRHTVWHAALDTKT